MTTTFPPQTRTPETEEAYRRRIAQMVDKVRTHHGLGPGTRPTERQMSDHFTALKPTVKKTTWRQYEAAIIYWIETTGEWQDEVLHELLSDRAKAKLQAASALPHGTNRTSAAKEKKISKEDFDALLNALRRPSNVANRGVLANLMIAQISLGLRPIEWFGITFPKGEHSPLLRVRSAKTTNGRGNGETRDIHLDHLSAEANSAILETAKWANTFATKEAFQKAIKALSKLLTDTCKRVFEGQNFKICFYTLRHQFIANAKKTLAEVEGSTAPQTLAALCGHATTRTAAKHYAKAKGAWSLQDRAQMALPTADQVLTVRITPNAEPSNACKPHTRV